jgi:translation elongation factor EF-1alpha
MFNKIMAEENIFLVEILFTGEGLGGIAEGVVKKGKLRIGMQTEINNKIGEITNIVVDGESKEEALEGQRCQISFVCKGIEKGEIKEGQEIAWHEPQ